MRWIKCLKKLAEDIFMSRAEEAIICNLVEEYKKYEGKILAGDAVEISYDIEDSVRDLHGIDIYNLTYSLNAIDERNTYPMEAQVSHIRPADPQEGSIRINSASMIVETWMNGGWRRVYNIENGRARLI